MKKIAFIIAGISVSSMAFAAGPHFELKCKETKLHGKHKGSKEIWDLQIPLGQLSFQSELRPGLTYHFATSAPGCLGKVMEGAKLYEKRTVQDPIEEHAKGKGKSEPTSHEELYPIYKLAILGDEVAPPAPEPIPPQGQDQGKFVPPAPPIMLSADACGAEIVQMKVSADYQPSPDKHPKSHHKHFEKQGALEIGGQATLGFDYAFHFFAYNTKLACSVQFVNPNADANPAPHQ